ELLPSCEYVSPAAGNEAEVLNLTRLPRNRLVRLKDVSAARSVNAELRFKADNELFQASAAALPGIECYLLYDAMTVAFTTIGQIITGGTSGAAAELVAVTPWNATGLFKLCGIKGTFQDNEIITGSVEGSATVNGTVGPELIKPTQYDLLATNSVRLAVYAIADLTKGGQVQLNHAYKGINI
ncbi:unnamed protein product, partial [marine sediment metagenome]